MQRTAQQTIELMSVCRIACLAQGHEAPVPVADHLIGASLELVLDEAQEMLLVHARRVMHVCVHLLGVQEASGATRPRTE